MMSNNLPVYLACMRNIHYLIFFVLYLPVFILMTACNKSETELKDRTQAMVALLDSISQNIDFGLNEYANSERLEYYNRVPPPYQTDRAINYHYSFAQELLKAGDTEKAIDRFKVVLDILEDSDNPEQEEEMIHFKYSVEEFLALSYLRLGEQLNCQINHTSQSCLFPIRGEGIHTLTEGSEKAIEIYQQILTERSEDDLISLWLLNIAYMTLGKHPYDVPQQWLIPSENFESDYDIGYFRDIAPQAGLADEMALSGGSITEDFNNNGFIDIVASSWGLTDQLQYFENSGDGKFINKTDEAGLTGITGGLNIMHADYNNNGFTDILVLRGAWLQQAGLHPNSLLRNNGDGTFSDVTESAGLLSFHPTQTAVWADFTNNGWLDLYIGNESTDMEKHPAELYINQQDGTFKNVAKEAGVDIAGYIKGVTAGDYNNDGLQDLYISRLDGENILFRNNGPDENGIPQFSNETQRAGVEGPFVSFPVWFWDFNNNGWLDLFVSAYDANPGDMAREYLGMPIDAGIPILYKNNGDGTFTNVTSEAGLNKVMHTMGSNFGDLDNDGYPDFYVGTGDPDFRSIMPNRMFRNSGGERFEEVTASGGFGHLQKGHGVSFADLNNDGNQDIFTVMGGAYEGDVFMNALFKNPGNNNNWITLLLSGVESNRSGIGNRIRIDVDTPAGYREIHKVVSTGGSFGSSSLQQEIGLGDATNIRQIEIYWPASGKKQIFDNVDMNRFYRISENRNQIEMVERVQFELGTGNSGH